MLITRRDYPPIQRKKITCGKNVFLSEGVDIFLNVKRARDDMSLELSLVFLKRETTEDQVIEFPDLFSVKKLPRGGPDFRELVAKYSLKIEEAVEISLIELATKAVRRVCISFNDYHTEGDIKDLSLKINLRIGDEIFDVICFTSKLNGFIVFE